MKLRILILLSYLPLLAACDRHMGVSTATGNTAPMTAVIDGQSNGEKMGTAFLAKSLSTAGITHATVANIAVGGTWLADHTAGGKLNAATTTTMANLRPQLYVWWQGEAEAALGGPGKDTYAYEFTNFIKALRQTGSNFTVVYVKLSANMAVAHTPFWETMRAQQDSIAIPNVYSVNIDDLKGDGLHYYPDEYQIASDRIVAAYVTGQNQ